MSAKKLSVKLLQHRLMPNKYRLKEVLARVGKLEEKLHFLSVSVDRLITMQEMNDPYLRERIEFLSLPESLQTSSKLVYPDRIRQITEQLSPKATIVDPSRPVICTVAVGESYARLVRPCVENHAAYCRHAGYNHLVLESVPRGPSRSPAWYKIPLVYKAFEMGFDQVFFLDADSLVMNWSVNPQTCFDELKQAGASIYLARERGKDLAWGSANSGVFFARRTPAAPVLLDLIWNNHPFIDHSLVEQQAIEDLYLRHAAFRRQVLVTENNRLFNSFSKEGRYFHESQRWQPGDFILHFCGMKDEKLAEAISHHVNAVVK